MIDEEENSSWPRRKSPVHLPNIHRRNQPIILYVTICTKNRQAILANDRVHCFLLDAWGEAQNYAVGKYVVMPDHIHLFCSPRGECKENVKNWVGFWKHLVSKNLREYRPVWQKQCWDRQLRHVDHYEEKWDYVRENPVRAGLVKRACDWKFQGNINELIW